MASLLWFSHPNMKSFRYVDRPSWAINQYTNNKSCRWSSSGPIFVGYEILRCRTACKNSRQRSSPHGNGEFSRRDDALVATPFLHNPEVRAACGFDRNGM
ncbi:unnamed protein product [Peronospora destructor]|uniref:Uncharacterized protein n=1 Tax=Peronospora destructor TaxID=86335 RepID=A0AAV0TE66_9STRA|nr:unnamed protein product [Peronospora destructor]